jgi:hypothetical protein
VDWGIMQKFLIILSESGFPGFKDVQDGVICWYYNLFFV